MGKKISSRGHFQLAMGPYVCQKKDEHLRSSILGTVGTTLLHFLLWAGLSGDIYCRTDAWLD